jgi:hypothetical protein
VNRLGVTVLSLVGASVFLFVLSVLSSRPVPEGDEPSGAVLRPSDPGSVSAAGQTREPRVRLQGEARSPRRAPPPRPVAPSLEDRPGSADRRREDSDEAPVFAAGRRPGAADPAGVAQDPGEAPSARRGDLVDFLSNDGAAGGPAPGGGRGGAESAATLGGWEMAGASEEVDAPGEAGDGAAVGEDDVVFSLPLAGDTQAEGALQPMAEENLKVDPQTGKVDFREDSVLAFPDAGNIQPKAGTIAFEVEPHWNGTDPGDNSFVQVRGLGEWQGSMALFRNGSGLRFVVFDEDGQETGVTAPIEDWREGEQHRVVATWDGDVGVMSIYVDGKLIEAGSYSGRLQFPPGTPLFVGSNPRHHVPGAAATLQNFKVFGRALDPEEVSAGVGLQSAAGEP